MFQSNLGGETTEQLDELANAMAASNIGIRSMVTEKDESKWDMGAYYTPNHAAIWNKVDNMGKRCQIMEKDDSIAVVQFEFKENTIDTLMSRIYRLEDLSLLPSQP